MLVKTDLVEQLETMVDAHGLLHILAALELMCGEKADHLRVNWQDNSTARLWDKAAKVCSTAARHAAVADVSP